MRSAWPSLFFVLAVGCSKPSPAPAPSASAAVAAAPAAPSAADPVPAPVATSDLPALDGFEGEIGWVASTKLAGRSKEPLNFVLRVKGGNLRIDAPAGVPGFEQLGKAYLLGKSKSKEFMAVLEGQKQVVRIDLEKMKAQSEALAAKQKKALGADAKKSPELKKTGRTDKVAGFSCEIWQIAEGGTPQSELCVANQPTPWFADVLPMVPSEYSWASELMNGKHFPLRVVAFHGKEESMRLEVSRIEKKPQEAALFEPPAGYRVLDLEQILQAMMQGMPGLSGARGAAPVLPPIPSAQPKKASK